MKKEKWINTPWAIGIGTAIFGLLLTIGYDYLKDRPVLTTIWAIIIFILTYKLPVFAFLSVIGLYFFTKLLIKFFSKKNDPIWDEQVGNYKFKELYKILSSQNLPIKTVGMRFSGYEPPEDNLLKMFHAYSTYFNKGVDSEDDLFDAGYKYNVLAPKLFGYGLLDKIETKNLELDIMDIKYQTSEVGFKFFALLEKSIHLSKDKKRDNKIKWQE
ncbi:MAG: hypothetical protein V4538_09075 [Bacteroidota bacterium]